MTVLNVKQNENPLTLTFWSCDKSFCHATKRIVSSWLVICILPVEIENTMCYILLFLQLIFTKVVISHISFIFRLLTLITNYPCFYHHWNYCLNAKRTLVNIRTLENSAYYDFMWLFQFLIASLNRLFYLSCLPGNVVFHYPVSSFIFKPNLVEFTCASFSTSMALLNSAISVCWGETVRLLPCHYLFFLNTPIVIHTFY
jgi:hypothetical protein